MNFGSTLSERRCLRTVFRDSPVRRANSLIEKCCRYRQRRMTLNNSLSITPRSPAMAEGKGSNMGQFSVEKRVLPGSALSGNQQRVLFVIDACDREIIAWSAAANGGVSGEMVRDLMAAAVERRFGATKTPHRVEWLSDNGSAYIAADTADTARALGLTILFTPARSPESNGMSESFVKTLKRDYARLTRSRRTPKRCLPNCPAGSRIIAKFTHTQA